jgi:hypothetical protein
MPISRADVALMDGKKTVLDTTQTSSSGYFHINLTATPSSILITEPGYMPITYYLPKDQTKTTYIFKLSNKSTLAQAETKVNAVLKFISSSIFEFLLVTFCVAQFYFAQNFGVVSVMPFIMISLVNLIMWTIFLSTQMVPQQFTELQSVKKD